MVVVGGSNPGHPGGPLQCGGGSQPSNHEHDDFDEKIYCVAMVKKKWCYNTILSLFCI